MLKHPSKTLLLILLLFGFPFAMSKMPGLYLADPSLGDIESRFGRDSLFVFGKIRKRVGTPLMLDSLITDVQRTEYIENRILLVNGQWVESKRVEIFREYLVADGDTLAYSGISALDLSGPFRWKFLGQGILVVGGGFALGGLTYDGGEYIENKDTSLGWTAGFGALGILCGAILGYYARDWVHVLIRDVKETEPE